MSKFPLLKTSVLTASALVLTTISSLALELPDGQTFFNRSPRLIRAATSFRGRNNHFATYYFTIEVPRDTGEALKAIKIEQRQNFRETIIFKAEESRAFIGDSLAGGEPLSLAAVGGEEETPGVVTVVLDPPVSPGNTITVAVKPKHNPNISGVYLFGVTTYPEGENSQGLYLGSGRLHLGND